MRLVGADTVVSQSKDIISHCSSWSTTNLETRTKELSALAIQVVSQVKHEGTTVTLPEDNGHRSIDAATVSDECYSLTVFLGQVLSAVNNTLGNQAANSSALQAINVARNYSFLSYRISTLAAEVQKARNASDVKEFCAEYSLHGVNHPDPNMMFGQVYSIRNDAADFGIAAQYVLSKGDFAEEFADLAPQFKRMADHIEAIANALDQANYPARPCEDFDGEAIGMIDVETEVQGLHTILVRVIAHSEPKFAALRIGGRGDENETELPEDQFVDNFALQAHRGLERLKTLKNRLSISCGSLFERSANST